ncbi:type II toxin-antitoxin system Phd/YefM family antitoxin [candidate division KSB1 bacterium]|nr:type II toxin-antitoxin system Phd/YefM family antitoxin [candidate division KSB1 bacterium]
METLDIKNIKPLTDFRNHMKEYINELKVNKKPIILTQHGKGTAVLLDADKYQELQDQIDFMRKVALGLDDIKHNRVHPFSDAVQEMDQIISQAETK